jgi:hypothetical protein
LLTPAPPPQEIVSSNSTSGDSHRYRGQRREDCLGRRTPGTNNIPREKVHNHDAGREDAGAEAGRGRAAAVRAVVTTLMVKVVGVVALKDRLEGREHVEPAGAPVQEREAVPLIPSPPIERV